MPSTRSFAPLANHCSSSLACSTKNEPSSPCGLPTRPTLTKSSATEDGERLCARRRDEDFLGGDLLGARMARGADERSRPLEVVVRSPELDVFVEDRPVRTRATFVRPAHAAGVDEQRLPHVPLELHARVAGD